MTGGAWSPARARSAERWRRRWNRLWDLRGSALAIFLGIGLLAVTMFERPRPRLLWNASLSSPVGLYAVTAPHGITAGTMVVAWPPGAIRPLAAERHYLPLNVPLVKRAAAIARDRVCAVGKDLFVNGRRVAERRRLDRRGRPLPWWHGCRRLAPGEVLLLSPGVPDAFDGRYFGISGPRDLVGRARHLWPFE